MFTFIRKAALGVALVASATIAATPADARDRYRHRGGGDDAAIAIAAGIAGLAIGAAIASDGRRGRYYDNNGYYDRRYRGSYYQPRQSYYYYPQNRGYNYDNYYYDRRYRDRYDRRYRDRYERKHRKWHRRHNRW